MITWKKGNLFEDHALILVNTVNCEGVMGKGIALEAKTRYPAMFQKYRADCRAGNYFPGCIIFDSLPDGRVICNAATKDKWREPSKLQWVEQILKSFAEIEVEKLQSYFSRSITFAVPPLGCGNGGLDWKVVKRLFEANLTSSPIDFRVYEP